MKKCRKAKKTKHFPASERALLCLLLFENVEEREDNASESEMFTHFCACNSDCMSSEETNVDCHLT